MSRDPASMTGLWHGLYSYPERLRPVFFVATLISHGSGFSGRTQEAAAGAEGTPLALGAAVAGREGGGTVEFTKTYEGAWQHTVLYAGRLSADRTEIEGAWTIPGIWSGRFLMRRGEMAEEAELRRAWEEA
ncbi:hypothetical protein Rumeso_01867 [Rubellimicrobium mesophilum DSM 19309]|uniref:Lipocalin-like domain-containing protein n=1 Tax=Rubellimicrobium mesophilum DSM 19309 TaxID=442562 RepID=A0A017HPZ4_9RHOB|nr:hypothetical protein [Rubellimicrobium mesophilum]EYD76446.1 hypothetical protein Rumeso_01867 [Rubellimicrobium mesophilum DSM 19309]